MKQRKFSNLINNKLKEMDKFLYKAKNCTDISDTTYAMSELRKMIESRIMVGKPVKKLYIMLGAVVKKHNSFIHNTK